MDHGHRAGLPVLDPGGPSSARREGEERAGIYAEHGAAPRVILSEAVAEPGGEHQHPLPPRHGRPHRVDESSGAFGHSLPAAAPAEAEALAGQGQEALAGAVGTAKAREAMAEHAVSEELADLLLDEAGQAVSVAAVRDLPEVGLEGLADEGVED